MTLPADAPPLRPADLFAMLRRHRVLAVCVAVLVGIAVLAAPSLLLPLRFRAEATLTMGRGLKPVTFQNDPVAGLVPEQMVNTQREMLTAKPTLRAAIAMSGLLDNPAYRRAADPAALLQQRLRATVVKNTWVIQVSLDDEDPVRAELGLQAVIDAYLAQQSTAQRSQGAEDISFVRAQLTEAEAALQTCRERERAFRHDNAIASTDPDRNHITARIQSLAERQALLDERVTASAALLAQVRAADTIADPTARMNAYLRIDQVSTATVVGALQQDLLRIEGQEAELSAKYLDKHPRLIEVRSLLAAKRAQLESTIAAARSAIESDHQRITAQRDALTEAQAGLQRDLDAYRGRLIELQQLAQTTAAQQKVHDELQARLAQLDALAGYDERRMSVSAPPRAAAVANGFGGPPLKILAVLLAVAAGVAAAAIADALGTRLADARQAAAATGLPVLAELPACRPGPLTATGPGAPASLVESVRSLWAALRYALPAGEGARIVLIASPQAGDGRTTLVARLAVAAGMAGARVLVVDGDLRRPGLAAQFGLDGTDGLARLLAGEPGLAPVASGCPNVDVMPAGTPEAHAGDLLHSHCLAEWLAACRVDYDLILIDAPDLSGSADALTIAGSADALLLLVRARGTGRDTLARAWAGLGPVRNRCLGVVVATCHPV